jgi:hypothetical protein
MNYGKNGNTRCRLFTISFLQNFVVTTDPSGINRVRYQAVSTADFAALQGYIRSMQEMTISNYNRAEQNKL